MNQVVIDGEPTGDAVANHADVMLTPGDDLVAGERNIAQISNFPKWPQIKGGFQGGFPPFQRNFPSKDRDQDGGSSPDWNKKLSLFSRL